jgi:hypothetical protein
MPYKPACGNCGKQDHKTPDCPRLTLIGRAVLEQCGITDEDAREAMRVRRRAMQATRVKVLQHKGDLLYSDPLPDYDVQLRAAQDVSTLLDHYPIKVGVEFGIDVKAMSDAELLGLMASLGADPNLMLPGGTA